MARPSRCKLVHHGAENMPPIRAAAQSAFLWSDVGSQQASDADARSRAPWGAVCSASEVQISTVRPRLRVPSVAIEGVAAAPRPDALVKAKVVLR